MNMEPKTKRQTEEDTQNLLQAIVPFWLELEHLGWVDGFGGVEFDRVFPKMLAFIRSTANEMP